jgi:hypothetical protein
MVVKWTKSPSNIPTPFIARPSKKLSKLGFGLKICHLATLESTSLARDQVARWYIYLHCKNPSLVDFGRP